MGVKRRQGSGDQQDLFDQALQASLRDAAPSRCLPHRARAVLSGHVPLYGARSRRILGRLGPTWVQSRADAGPVGDLDIDREDRKLGAAIDADLDPVGIDHDVPADHGKGQAAGRRRNRPARGRCRGRKS